MDSISDWINNYGEWFYVITFVWAFLEGETFVIFSGAAAAAGLVDLRFLIIMAWLGSFSGDQLWFYLGRRFGVRILEKFPRFRPKTELVLSWLEKWKVIFILSFRFIYGVRNVASFAMGMSSLSWAQFASLNFVAASLWATSFASAGFLFGHALTRLAAEGFTGLSVTLLAVFVLAVGLKIWLGRRHAARRQAAVATGSGPPVGGSST